MGSEAWWEWQSMGQLLSKDSGARAWKHATRSATSAARKRSCNALISWQNRRATLAGNCGKDVVKIGGPLHRFLFVGSRFRSPLLSAPASRQDSSRRFFA